MGTKIVVLDRIDPTEDHLKRLRSMVGPSGVLNSFHDQINPGTDWDLIVKRIGDSEIIVTSWTDFPATLINRLPKVKMLSVVATSYSWIDVEAATEHGIVVTNVPGYAGIAVAEMTFGLLLSLLRRIHIYHLRTKSGDFTRLGEAGAELSDKTIGIIGTGAIGSNVARIANGFNMRVMAYNKHMSQARAKALGVQYVELDTLLKESDIVTVHVPLTDETKGMFDEKTFNKMKDKSIFVCTSRPETYDDQALRKAIESGKLGGVALDETSKVFQTVNNPLLSRPNVLVTPEVGFFTEQALVRLVDISIDNVEAFLKGIPVNVVNPGARLKFASL